MVRASSACVVRPFIGVPCPLKVRSASVPPVSTPTPAQRAGLEPGRALAYVVGLVDDAAVFPPSDLAVVPAVAAHREHRAATYGLVLGPFLAPVSRLGEVLDALDAERTSEPLDLVLVADTGLVEAAEAEGRIEPGRTTIVEATSAAARGSSAMGKMKERSSLSSSMGSSRR